MDTLYKILFRQKTKLGSLEMFPMVTSFPMLAALHTKGNTHAFSFEQNCPKPRVSRAGIIGAGLRGCTVSHCLTLRIMLCSHCLDILKFKHEAPFSFCTEPHKLCSWLWVSCYMPHVRAWCMMGTSTVFFPVGLYRIGLQICWQKRGREFAHTVVMAAASGVFADLTTNSQCSGHL